jgi:hypothetical protein
VIVSDVGVVLAAVVADLGLATALLTVDGGVGRVRRIVGTSPTVDGHDAFGSRSDGYRVRCGVGDHAERREREDPDAHGEESLGKDGHRYPWFRPSSAPPR